MKTAAKEDYIRVRDFYYSLTDAMEHAEFNPGWKKDVYPTHMFYEDTGWTDYKIFKYIM